MTWLNKTISTEKITVQGLITEPGETTTIFNVYATEPAGGNMGWIIYTIDFKPALGSFMIDLYNAFLIYHFVLNLFSSEILLPIFCYFMF